MHASLDDHVGRCESHQREEGAEAAEVKGLSPFGTRRGVPISQVAQKSAITV